MPTPTDFLTRIDQTKLWPPFLARVQALARVCSGLGRDYYGTSGLRSFLDQQAIYAQGRTAPCGACRDKGITDPCGHVMTRAKPGQSYHNYGLAVDFAFDSNSQKPGLQPSWAFADYRVLAEEAVKLGLEPGFYWTQFPDCPHVQVPLSGFGVSLTQLLSLYKNGGLVSTWAYLDQFKW